MTKTHKHRIERKIRQFAKKELNKGKIGIRHIYTQAYVVGFAAPSCLVVAQCWTESEKQKKDFNRANPLQTIRCFDSTLNPGDWCTTAYITTETSGEPVAIPIVL